MTKNVKTVLKLVTITILLSLTSCSSVGTVLQGAGDGLTKASKRKTHTYQCYSDGSGGANCYSYY